MSTKPSDYCHQNPYCSVFGEAGREQIAWEAVRIMSVTGDEFRLLTLAEYHKHAESRGTGYGDAKIAEVLPAVDSEEKVRQFAPPWKRIYRELTTPTE